MAFVIGSARCLVGLLFSFYLIDLSNTTIITSSHPKPVPVGLSIENTDSFSNGSMNYSNRRRFKWVPLVLWFFTYLLFFTM